MDAVRCLPRGLQLHRIAPSHGGERSIKWNLLARKIAREPLAAHTIDTLDRQ